MYSTRIFVVVAVDFVVDYFADRCLDYLDYSVVPKDYYYSVACCC